MPSSASGLGTLVDVPVGEARETARRYRTVLASGSDPLIKRERERRETDAVIIEERAKLTTFKEFAEPIITQLNQQQLNNKANWAQSIRDHAYPALGSMVIDDIEQEHTSRC